MRKNPGHIQLIGKSSAFLEEINKIPLIAKYNATVLISGESGTGKELFAQAIHFHSARADKPFVPVNCGAIPINLFEDEFFGHVIGAFTGAESSRSGLISEANGGSLFLDEIGSLHAFSQATLLRFLQEKEYRQVGSSRLYRADVRIIAATNMDLKKGVEEGKFRRDLFYRLIRLRINLPPLRERREDIKPLACHFLKKFNELYSKKLNGFSTEALHKLLQYDWPGNIRELENIIESAVIFSDNNRIESHDIVLDIVLPESKSTVIDKSFKSEKARFEKNYIEGCLQENNGNISKAARAAQKDRRAFWELMRKHNIDPQNFKF